MRRSKGRRSLCRECSALAPFREMGAPPLDFETWESNAVSLATPMSKILCRTAVTALESLDASLANQFLDALHPAAIGSDAHLVRFEDHFVFAAFLQVDHHFAGSGRGGRGAAQLREHGLCGAIEIDADPHAAGQLDLHLLECLDRANRKLRRRILFA